METENIEGIRAEMFGIGERLESLTRLVGQADLNLFEKVELCNGLGDFVLHITSTLELEALRGES